MTECVASSDGHVCATEPDGEWQPCAPLGPSLAFTSPPAADGPAAVSSSEGEPPLERGAPPGGVVVVVAPPRKDGGGRGGWSPSTKLLVGLVFGLGGGLVALAAIFVLAVVGV